MQKLHSIATISNAAMPSDLKSYLVQKMENIEKTYHCDMGDILSVILLEKQEKSYLLDKGLEFYEILSFSHSDWIHTVWASSDGYSEDIYIPFPQKHRNLWKEGAADVFGKPLSDKKNP